MGQHDASFGQPVISPDDDMTYETRELAWELTQSRIDSIRIRFLIDTGADVAAALHLAQLTPQALRHPRLRPLGLHRHLVESAASPAAV